MQYGVAEFAEAESIPAVSGADLLALLTILGTWGVWLIRSRMG